MIKRGFVILATIGFIISIYLVADMLNCSELTIRDEELVLIVVELGNEKGIMLFDTGSDVSCIKQDKIKSYKHLKTDSVIITDANNIKQYKYIYEINNVQIAGYKISSTPFITDINLDFVDVKFDSSVNFIGIIGKPIISEFKWDFNLKDKKLKLSKRFLKKNNIDGFNLIHLDEISRTTVDVNGVPILMKFDTGCTYALVFSDSLKFENIYRISNIIAKSKKTSSLFNSSVSNSSTAFIDIGFTNIFLGNDFYSKCIFNFGNNERNLLGVSFLNQYKRVIIDDHGKRVLMKDKLIDEAIPNYATNRNFI